MYKLVLLRHGMSKWNFENRFTGWHDVDLAEQGINEARKAGAALQDAGFDFDIAYVSMLRRAIRTLWIVADEMDRMWLPVIHDWRLNERHYGALTGLNKAETARRHGEEQVHIWRRGYDVRPPELTQTSEYYSGNLRMYEKIPKAMIPNTECLKDTVVRVLEFWNSVITKSILSGKRVLITAHGNSLRALVKHLDGMTEKEVMELNIPTGIPLVYEMDDSLKPTRHYYLADDETLNTAIASVAYQGKAK